MSQGTYAKIPLADASEAGGKGGAEGWEEAEGEREGAGGEGRAVDGGADRGAGREGGAENEGFFDALRSLCPDAKLLMLSKSVRMYAFGYLAVMLVIYLKELGFLPATIGLLFTLTLLGDVLLSLLLTTHADRWGRKRTLLAGAALALTTSLTFALSSSFSALLLAAIFGVISPSGNEIGPFQAIEISALSEVTPQRGRTMLMGWYNLFSCFASALGALSCGLLMDALVGGGLGGGVDGGGGGAGGAEGAELYGGTGGGVGTGTGDGTGIGADMGRDTGTHAITGGYTVLQAARAAMVVYASLKLLLLVVFWQLSPLVEVQVGVGEGEGGQEKGLVQGVGKGQSTGIGQGQGQVQGTGVGTGVGTGGEKADSFMGLRKSKHVVVKLSLLFMLDSFGGSFILQSIISGWMHDKFNTSGVHLGSVVFACNLVAGISALFAARLADKIGLILTMVVTHLPSNVLIMLLPLMPTEAWAMAVLIARYSISQMDVPTRNAYIQGVVEPDERSAANGVTNVVRSLGASTGPYLAGLLFQRGLNSWPFFIAGGVKIVYDVLLLWSMSNTPTAEEREKKERGEKREVEMGLMTDETETESV